MKRAGYVIRLGDAGERANVNGQEDKEGLERNIFGAAALRGLGGLLMFILAILR